MALKIASGNWISASQENRVQRNAKRQDLFNSVGIQPASSMRKIHIEAKQRLDRTMTLFSDAAGSRIDDENLVLIAELMKATIHSVGLSAPSIMRDVERQTLGILGFSPEVLKAFFESDHDTSLERSMVD